jgi:hypothetical protein
MPVSITNEATTNKLTINGSKNNESPKPIEPTIKPIAIPTIGKIYMYFAIVSRFELLVGIIVKNEKTEPISLSMNPPSQRR